MPIFGLRLAVASAIAGLTAVALGPKAGLLWGLGAASAEIGTWLATHRTRRGLSQTRRQRLVYLLAVLWMNIVWSGLGVVLWLDGRAVCVGAAVCMLATQMLHAQVFASRSPAVLVAVGLPPVAALTGLVAFASTGGWSERLLIVGAAAIMVSYMTKAGLTNARNVQAREAARLEAERTAARKAAFLADMSHELRTPLTSILGFTRLLAGEGTDPALARSYVARIEDASQALLHAVNDLLDYSKLEAGGLSVTPEPTQIRELAKDTLDLFAPQAAAKGIDLVFDGDLPEATVVMLDSGRVRQVLLNLIGNAVKFTASGSVTLSASVSDATQMRLAVSDTGPGMAPEQLGRLFQRFSQVGTPASQAGGTGLGLAICKGLVQAMGGDIGVTSRPGEGSCFWFTLPIRAEDASAGASALVETGGAEGLLAGVRVLVVDDHPANRELASLFLRGVGADVDVADDGEMAVAMCAAGRFDVLLLDQRMPGLDGPQTLARLRQARTTPSVALAFTADPAEMTPARLDLLGLAGVVSKPLEPGALLATMVQALERQPDGRSGGELLVGQAG